MLDQPTDTIYAYAIHPIASHFLDLSFTTPSAPLKLRRRIITTLTPHLYDLSQDKIGSRVTEQVWEASDGYTKEKIAKILLPHGQQIKENRYGRHLYPRLQLELLQRRPDLWRTHVIGVKHHFAHQKEAKGPAAGGAVAVGEKRKVQVDEIDELFAAVEGKKSKKVIE